MRLGRDGMPQRAGDGGRRPARARGSIPVRGASGSPIRRVRSRAAARAVHARSAPPNERQAGEHAIAPDLRFRCPRRPAPIRRPARRSARANGGAATPVTLRASVTCTANGRASSAMLQRGERGEQRLAQRSERRRNLARAQPGDGVLAPAIDVVESEHEGRRVDRACPRDRARPRYRAAGRRETPASDGRCPASSRGRRSRLPRARASAASEARVCGSGHSAKNSRSFGSAIAPI